MQKNMLQHKQLPLKLKKKRYKGENELEIVSTLWLGLHLLPVFN